MMQPPVLPNTTPHYVLAAMVLGIGLMIGWLVLEVARMAESCAWANAGPWCR